MKQAFLYNELVRFYNRSRLKLQRLAAEGKNLRKQDILQRRIVRLFQILSGMQRALRLGITTAAVSAGMLLFQPNAVHAQPEITFAAAQTNPFGLTDIGSLSSPAFGDLDGDGDMDLMAGAISGIFFYFQNTGTVAVPAFASAQTNPFGLGDVGSYCRPALADLDGDGDLDLLAGEYYGRFYFFQNTGTPTAPSFAGAQINPFGLADIGWYSAPSFADLDGDGDVDVMAGLSTGFKYFQNTGTPITPAFAAVQTNPFGLTGSSYSPAFANLDVDGDLDLISGSYSGYFYYLQNTGTASSPAFAGVQTIPVGLTDIGWNSTPALADLDGDGQMDLMAGESEGNFFYFQNITPCLGITVFADADNDGYGDAATSQFFTGCIVPAGFVFDSTDCDDGSASTNPGACDGINGIDNNCNGITDDGSGTVTFYADADGDGYGDIATHVNECISPAGYVRDSTDCDDAVASSHPGAIEVINGIDDNCDGTVDGDFWTPKADIPETVNWALFGFSIGSKGYVGLYEDHFWEYDPATSVWTQKDDYDGGTREKGVGFSIGSKGYIGTGEKPSGNWTNDFWEYDPALNTWTRKADVGELGRVGAIGFSIGNKGYIGCGNFPIGWCCASDFWEYDPATDTWTEKAQFAGTDRIYATGFSIGNKGYVGLGYSLLSGWLSSFWEYDPATDAWTVKASFPGGKRERAVAFSIGSKGYMGTGANSDYTNYFPKQDFYEYEPLTNGWTRKTDYPGGATYSAVGFSIGNRGYIADELKFWEYAPECYSGLTVYADSDGDGYGDISKSLFESDCIPPAGYVFDSTDCNDGDAGIHPGAIEIVNGIDDNCSGIADEVTCPLATKLSVSNITGTSAKLKWDPVSGAESYKVRYKVSGTNEWTIRYSTGKSRYLYHLSPNTGYTWELKTYCTVNPGVSSDWSAKQEFTTGSLRMGDESVQQISFQIYPNPAEDQATIQFTLPHALHVYISVCDAGGKEIEILLSHDLEQGGHALKLNTSEFAKGVYVVKMICDEGIENRKLVVQ